VLGGALLSFGDGVNAEKVFRAELEKHHRNGRALFGLAESLRKQGKESAAKMVDVEFQRAWQEADTKLTVPALIGAAPGADTGAVAPRTSDVQFASLILKTGVRLHYAYKGVAEMVAPYADVELKKNQDADVDCLGRLVSALKNSKLRVYADTGHAPHWERPEWFAKDLQDFIN
jgi:pimeloyl-ACP methyl ester carboxylesterase